MQPRFCVNRGMTVFVFLWNVIPLRVSFGAWSIFLKKILFKEDLKVTSGVGDDIDFNARSFLDLDSRISSRRQHVIDLGVVTFSSDSQCHVNTSSFIDFPYYLVSTRGWNRNVFFVSWSASISSCVTWMNTLGELSISARERMIFPFSSDTFLWVDIVCNASCKWQATLCTFWTGLLLRPLKFILYAVFLDGSFSIRSSF